MNRILNITNKWWWPPVLMWFATRIVTTMLFLIVAYIQGDNYWTPAHPGYFDFLNIWDVEWYHRIFTEGYPVTLPTSDGVVSQNAWAFMPAFPYTVKLLSLITTIDWKFLAPFVATVFSFIAAVLVYKLFVRYVSPQTALWAIALLGLWCASPALQAGYADSMGLAALAFALLLIDERKYLLAMIPTAVFALSRPGAIAIAGALALIFADRLWHTRKHPADFPITEKLQLAFATAIAGALGLAWPAIAWLVTGQPDAYLKTELAWSYGYTGSDNLHLFQGWIVAANWDAPGGIGLVALALIVAAVVWSLLSPTTVALGLTMRTWMAAYWAYLFAFFFPQSSTWRILMPLLPLFAFLAVKTDKANRYFKALLVLVLIGLQLFWLLNCWMYTAPDYTPP